MGTGALHDVAALLAGPLHAYLTAMQMCTTTLCIELGLRLATFATTCWLAMPAQGPLATQWCSVRECLSRNPGVSLVWRVCCLSYLKPADS